MDLGFKKLKLVLIKCPEWGWILLGLLYPLSSLPKFFLYNQSNLFYQLCHAIHVYEMRVVMLNKNLPEIDSGQSWSDGPWKKKIEISSSSFFRMHFILFSESYLIEINFDRSLLFYKSIKSDYCNVTTFSNILSPKGKEKYWVKIPHIWSRNT